MDHLVYKEKIRKIFKQIEDEAPRFTKEEILKTRTLDEMLEFNESSKEWFSKVSRPHLKQMPETECSAVDTYKRAKALGMITKNVRTSSTKL